ncbi:hypothetical protein [Klebsiella michiganensis]|uniref:hypothetical protein n=1 Tax=Klebsiella michiganensis TaxID=1134687 RepID=UPI000AADA488|nr:hypothetical protein [Klebsiella michiganensis]
MTDITELAQSLKRRAASANEFGEGLYVKGADIIALVDALEKAQETIAFQQGEIKALLSSLESRTVKMPKPHAHLIWIQAGHAPDDYWDDVAVSHSEKDRCCDGSERYPVYARWEIEEMLAAAGIKWEAE